MLSNLSKGKGNIMAELKGAFKKLDNNIFLLRYDNDYGLDDCLAQGVNNVAELGKFLISHFKAQPDDIKMNKGGYACTSFNAHTPDGQHILARNFDYKKAPAVVVWTNPANGYKSVGITDTNVMLYGGKLGEKEKKTRLLMAPYACMDGINEKGFAIAVLEIKTKATNQQTGKKGVTTTLMIRAALDKCATVDEAIELFGKYDMHDSLFCNYHYHLVDASGKSAVIEYINNKMNVVYPDDKYQYCLNFYNTPNVHVDKAFGFTRQKWLIEEFKKTNHIMDEDYAMSILEKCKLYYRHKRGYMITSLWSAIYNLDNRSLLLCANMEFDKKYKFTIDPPEYLR